MNAACRGSVAGSSDSPSTTTNPELVGSATTPAGGGSLEMISVTRFDETVAFPYGSVLPPSKPAPQSGDTAVSVLPAAAPSTRTTDASHASASAATPTEVGHGSVPAATEGGPIPVGSAVGSSADGVAAGPFAAPGARVYVVGRYLDTGREVLAKHVHEGESYEVGRKPGTPFEHDRYVERYHAALVPTRNGVLVEDFGAQNGVFARISGPELVRDDDQFRIGEQLLAVQSLALPEEAGARAIGCPDPGYWARIDMLLRPDLVAASYPVDECEAVIGRDEGSIQFPDDAAVSPVHCRLRADEDRMVLEDLASEHGTFLRLRAQQVVPYGTTLLIGQTLIRVERNG
jgi:pSer/pThr/pTyr-binding forkhead associated (FHA) protein